MKLNGQIIVNSWTKDSYHPFIIFSERSRNRTCPGQKAPEKLPHTSHSIFMDQHLRAGVCVCVCVCVLHVHMCVEGSSFTGKCLNQTSGRDDKSALWFGAQRLAAGSKRSTALQLCRFQRAKFNHHHFLLGSGTRAHLPTSCLAYLLLVA